MKEETTRAVARIVLHEQKETLTQEHTHVCDEVGRIERAQWQGKSVPFRDRRKHPHRDTYLSGMYKSNFMTAPS